MEKMGRDAENYAKWQKDNLKSYTFKLNKTTDGEIINWLDAKPNKRDYLIGLIRKDMEKS